MSDGGLGDFSLMELFRTEVDTQVGELNDGLLALESSPGNVEALTSLMRAAHSLKGAARIVGLDAAVKVAHAMEDCLEAAKDEKILLDPDHVDFLLQGVDFFVQLKDVTEEEAPGWLAAQESTIETLSAALQAIKEGRTPEPSAAVVEEAEEATPAPAPPEPTAPAPVEQDDEESNAITDFSMMDLFRAELDTQVQALNAGMLALEAQPDDRESLDALMRAAHSLKGAARIVGLDSAVKLSHAMEDCLEDAKEGKLTLEALHIDVLFAGVDLLSKIGEQPDDGIGAWLDGHKPIIATLVGDIQAVRSGKPLDTSPLPAAALQAAPVTATPDVPKLPAELAPVPEAKPAPTAPPSRTAAPAKAAAESGSDRSVKVTAEALDRLMGLAAETLVETRRLQPFSNDLLRLKSVHSRLSNNITNLRQAMESGELRGLGEMIQNSNTRMEEARHELSAIINSFEAYSRQTTNLTDRLYREIIGSRMRPFVDALTGFPRLVRDVSRKLGKKIRLDTDGLFTEVDRDILQKLEAPLNHLLRNAMDHGIETPIDRAVEGKPEMGTLNLEARHRAGMLIVTVKDDGRGISKDKLRQKILDKELSSPEMLDSMSEQELFDFLFLPGFSTAASVTEISGRGVGLDVVQSMVHEAGGTVRVFSTFGAGTTFQLQLPITRSVIRALLARIGDEPYAFPLARIDRALTLPVEKIENIESRQFFPLDGDNIGLISAVQVLQLDETREEDEDVAIVVVSERSHRYGLAVDEFLGERDLVVRPLDERLGKVPDISSASMLEDGSPVLIIDVEDIARSIDSLLSGGGLRRIRTTSPRTSGASAKRILVVDDSVTVREVERKLLENHGYEVEVAVDGMEGWNAVRLDRYDLIITDVDMPRMNGIEFVKHIKGDANLRDIPVMIVSYKDREEDRLRGMEAGANYYLTKSSFHDETLIHAVEELIGQARESSAR